MPEIEEEKVSSIGDDQYDDESYPPGVASDEEKAKDLTRGSSHISIAETLSLPHEIAFVAVVCMAQAMTQAGLAQCLSILRVVGDSMGLSNTSELSWLIASYSLTVGTFILFAGRLGDLFGYKKMILIGFSWFSVWSMIAGLSVYSNYVLFNFARASQGLGPAILLPNALAILGATYRPGPRKAMVFAIFGATAPGGAVLGATFAALLALEWWPWAFFAFAIVLAVLVVLSYLIIPSPPPAPLSNEPLSEKLHDLDLPGAITGILALVLINFAWNQAPIVGWSTPYVYIILILGLLFVPVFFFIELRVARKPLIPLHALNTDVAFVLGCVACGWGCFGIWALYVWQFFLEARHASPLLASGYFSPAAVSGACAAVITGFLLGRLRPATVMIMALTAFTVGSIIIATAPVDQSYWAQCFVNMVIMPFGMDMSFPAATLILSNAVGKEHQGIAASLVNTVVNYSISLGLGFAGTVEVHVNNGGHTTEDLLKGYRGAWYVGIGLAGLGMVISLIYSLNTRRSK
ncbi:MFS general substrate transporter [Patellaria atrata CBS 101060]|uniref:MFS general substrate transporter n=1 Tax=Patellaria atrata CBS 101060 TaxID=1346257 RepID=A0A9P4VPJ0_9PEZI|nr:MFS general substrate transporter [Patellaria atrata CBS 101060]